VGAHREVSLWGSPSALSRLAIGLLGAANAAERVGVHGRHRWSARRRRR
jgi:hypothetical protein